MVASYRIKDVYGKECMIMQYGDALYGWRVGSDPEIEFKVLEGIVKEIDFKDVERASNV